MITLKNFQRVVTTACVAIVLNSIALPVFAQTAEQMKVFQSLPPEQQQEILKAIGEGTNGPQQTTTTPAPASPTSMPKPELGTEPVITAAEPLPRLRAGDIVVGDADGVVVIPVAQADAVLARLRAVQAAEKAAEDSVKAGATAMPSWHEIHRQARIIQS